MRTSEHFVSKLQWFYKKTSLKKKSKKLKSTLCFTDQDAIVVQQPSVFTAKLRGHKITTTKERPWELMMLQRQNEW